MFWTQDLKDKRHSCDPDNYREESVLIGRLNSKPPIFQWLKDEWMSPEIPIIILIIAIPTYFLFKWVLKKLHIANEINRKVIAVLLAIVFSPLIYVGVVTIWVFSVSYYPNKSFDQLGWNSNIEERYEMSKDIIESNMLIGMTRDEVISILGNDYSSSNESRITYELGFKPGLFNIDPDVLEIRFENGIVVDVYQYEG